VIVPYAIYRLLFDAARDEYAFLIGLIEQRLRAEGFIKE
jgi:hypothetical protein